jgi:predicted flap endonuclease-1-like 5' DNA nuclease
MTRLDAIEGIGAAFAAKLRAVGVGSIEGLLSTGATPAGRKELVTQTGISMALILKWVNRADLMRIRGVGEEYSDLLELAGVDTVAELAQRRPDALHKKMIEVNEVKKAVRRPPALKLVQSWVDQAKKLPRAVSY